MPSGLGPTVGERLARPAPDLVGHNFTASGPDQVWVAGITDVPTAAGFQFLSARRFLCVQASFPWSRQRSMVALAERRAVMFAQQVSQARVVLSRDGCKDHAAECLNPARAGVATSLIGRN